MVVFGMGQAMDAWLVSQELDADSRRELAATFVAMLRKALS